MFWYILLVIVIILFIKFQWSRRRFFEMCKNMKNDVKAMPIIGHGYLVIGNNENLMGQIQRFGREAIKHGGLTYVWSGNIFCIVVADAEVIDIVSKSCLQKPYAVDFLAPFFGNASLIAPVPIWRHRRKLINPTFRQQNLNQFVNRVFSRQSSVMVERLREVDGKGTLSILNFFLTYNLDAIGEAALGVQLGVQSNPEHPLLKAFKKCSQLVTERISKPWLHPNTIYKLLPQYKTFMKNSKVIGDLIDEIIKFKSDEIEMEKINSKGINYCNANDDEVENSINLQNLKDTKPERLKPLLELMLLEATNKSIGLTKTEIREEIILLVLASIDTSAMTAAFATVLLSRHSNIQEKVYQELQEVFGKVDRPIEAVDLPRLKYLEAVIKETLRLYPPGPVILRQLEEDLKLPSGLTLVAGAGVCFNIWAMHRNPRYWGEDAEVFRPERFLEAPLKHPAAFVPFSFGPRNCPGQRYAKMSMLTVLATFLQKYEVFPVAPPDERASSNPSDYKHKPLRVTIDLIMTAVDGFNVEIKSRT